NRIKMRGWDSSKSPAEMKPLLVEIPASLIVEAGSPLLGVVHYFSPHKIKDEGFRSLQKVAKKVPNLVRSELGDSMNTKRPSRGTSICKDHEYSINTEINGAKK
ncbi:MAG: hypothetical protein ACTSYT_04000, partial [Candidatus Asgardarchaeia archaeon]